MKYPAPTFLNFDTDDGSLYIEWCFGGQGADDSWRVSHFYDPDTKEPFVIKTGPGHAQVTKCGIEAGPFLKEVLESV